MLISVGRFGLGTGSAAEFQRTSRELLWWGERDLNFR